MMIYAPDLNDTVLPNDDFICLVMPKWSNIGRSLVVRLYNFFLFRRLERHIVEMCEHISLSATYIDSNDGLNTSRAEHGDKKHGFLPPKTEFRASRCSRSYGAGVFERLQKGLARHRARRCCFPSADVRTITPKFFGSLRIPISRRRRTPKASAHASCQPLS